ncbi:MAG: hypothetical protein AAFX06_10175 [Planctomycetota bacterium]
MSESAADSAESQLSTNATSGIRQIQGDEGSVSNYSLADQIAAAKHLRRAKSWTPRGVMLAVKGPSIAPPSARGN